MRKLSSILFLIIFLNFFAICSFSGDGFRKFTVEESFLVLDGIDSRIKKIIDRFVAYEHKGKKLFKYSGGTRPVYVYQTRVLPGKAIGLALPFLNVCVILLNDKYIRSATNVEIELLFIHEYLHCQFYRHATDPKDIMYPHVDSRLNPYSIFNYFDDMVKYYD